MPYIIAIAYIAGLAIGLVVFYYILRAAVRDGIIAAKKITDKKE